MKKPAIIFKPVKYQKAVFDNIIEKDIPIPSQRLSHHPYPTIKNDDCVRLRSPLIIFDELGSWPPYKWYRNPIKLWKFRRMEKRILDQMPNIVLQSNNKSKDRL